MMKRKRPREDSATYLAETVSGIRRVRNDNVHEMMSSMSVERHRRKAWRDDSGLEF